MVDPLGITIEDFTCISDPNHWWTLQGDCSNDESLLGTTVRFSCSSIPEMMGLVATIVEEHIGTDGRWHGRFQTSVQIAAGEDGVVNAQATDADGGQSNTAEFYIHNP